MTATESVIEKVFQSQRSYFDSAATRSYEFRIVQLRKLKKAIASYEQKILNALNQDMHKPAFEAFTSEVGVMYEEINHTIKHLKKWMKNTYVHTPLVLHPSSSKIIFEPLGIVLIIGPWNYPFQLLFAPLVGAIAAGNTAILKPSDNTKHTAAIIEKLINETFESKYISVITGPGAMVGPMLIEKYKFDHIFFTGSPGVGKQIMTMAAQHLTPVTLELGGKSPAIVDQHVDLKVAAKRLIWSKFFNAGQTCVAPDYLLIHQAVKDDFILEMKKNIIEFYGTCQEDNPNLTHIVNNKRFDKLMSYLTQGNILHGGSFNKEKRFIEPTLIDGVSLSDSIMQEEIFGPILPILTYSKKEEVIEIVRHNRYPLACYIFSSDNKFSQFIIDHIEFGGGAINNALLHLANPNLPFGGVGNSGMGSYHGKRSFEVMSHAKSILATATFLDPSFKYAPYTPSKMHWAHRFFK
ncbi:MAG: aldehyde dehydrogenase [Bacteroidetes bacterium]|nr:aldehyde dehydrogenase [Bacteroidota bacterium]